MLNMPEELLGKLKRLALRDRRSCTNYIAVVLEKHVGDIVKATEPKVPWSWVLEGKWEDRTMNAMCKAALERSATPAQVWEQWKDRVEP